MTSVTREEMAREIARELMRQDGDDIAPDHDPFPHSRLTWGYIDQGEVDFGKIVDALAALQAKEPPHER